MLYSQVNVAAPAGAIVSTARDMSRWMMWHLSGGNVPPPTSRTRPLIDKDKLWDTYRGRDVLFTASGQQVDYALGWYTNSYRGMIWHGFK